MALRDVSPQRKALHYLGLVLLVAGFCTFISVFVSGALHFGDFSDFENQNRSMMLRAVGGMVTIIIGTVCMSVARGGTAGSGLVMDPQKARQDVEPWSRMTGGVVRDVLDEAGLAPSARASATPSFDEQLRSLHRLHQDGILSTAEFEAQKKKLLERA